MVNCHVVAYVQADGGVTMHRTGSHPGFAGTVHHAVVRANEELTVIVWWRERLKPQEEQKQNALIAEKIQKEFMPR